MINIQAESQRIDNETAKVAAACRKAGRPLRLVDIIASDDAGVASYARSKVKKADMVGIEYIVLNIERPNAHRVLSDSIDRLNEDPATNGIMISTPVFQGLDADLALSRIDKHKDIDGLGPLNTANLAINRENAGLIPATARAAILMIELIMPLAGKDVVVVGRGRTIGRPVAQMAVNRDATVTVCHSRTPDLAARTCSADIIISAAGRHGLLTSRHVRAGQIVIDCGISFKDGKVVGDVEQAEVRNIVAYLSPVPGGVGTLTNSLLFDNLCKAASMQLPNIGDNH